MKCKACDYDTVGKYLGLYKGEQLYDKKGTKPFKLLNVSKPPDIMGWKIGGPAPKKIDLLYSCPECGTVRVGD